MVYLINYINYGEYVIGAYLIENYFIINFIIIGSTLVRNFTVLIISSSLLSVLLTVSHCNNSSACFKQMIIIIMFTVVSY